MSRRAFYSFSMIALIFLAGGIVSAQRQTRIGAAIDGERVRISGNVHPMARPEFDRGQLADSFPIDRMMLVFNKTSAQQAELDTLVQQQTDPASPNFHKWLSPAEYASRFGMSDSDIQKASSWLASQGFKVVEVANSKSFIIFSGTAAQVKSAFGTEIHRYVVNGESHFANASEPTLPAALSSVVVGVHGMSDFHPQPRGVVSRSRTRPNFTSSISGNHFIVPDDFATIYDLKPLYNQGIDGTGVTIAVMGQTAIIPADVSTFRSLSGLPATPVNVINVGTPPGVKDGDIDEANLDLQWAGAVAPGASLTYVNSNDTFNSLAFAVNNNVAPIISISYGGCEGDANSPTNGGFPPSDMTFFNNLAQQGNAQGITVVGPSGDSGAADCDFSTSPTQVVASGTRGMTVDFPASSPFVTAVGGTQLSAAGSFWNSSNNSLSGSALSYIPETAWNETTLEISQGGSLAGSGGGPSKFFSKPSWQVGPTPADGQRDVPDLSFNAAFDSDSEGYLTCSQGSCVNGFRQANNNLTVVGGTSAGVPVFAGVVALLNQSMNGRQGNANPKLYQVAATSSDAFHDITSGDNIVPCKAGTPDCPSTGKYGFSAGTGYDFVTGLGSIDIYNFVSEWKSGASTTPPAPDFSMSGSVQTLSFTRTNSGTLKVSVAGTNGFNGTVNLTCSVPAALVNVTCAASPTSLAAGGSATVTVSSTAISSLAPSKAPFGRNPNWNWMEASFGAAFGLLLCKPKKSATKRSRILRWAAMTAAALLMLTLAACGGGSSSNLAPTTTPTTTTTTTPVGPQTGTVIIQGTSHANIHIVPITVTVN